MENKSKRNKNLKDLQGNIINHWDSCSQSSSMFVQEREREKKKNGCASQLSLRSNHQQALLVPADALPKRLEPQNAEARQGGHFTQKHGQKHGQIKFSVVCGAYLIINPSQSMVACGKCSK